MQELELFGLCPLEADLPLTVEAPAAAAGAQSCYNRNRCDGHRADSSSTSLLCNHIAHGLFADPPYFVAPRHTAQRRGQPAPARASAAPLPFEAAG